jgi:hypothetical protein
VKLFPHWRNVGRAMLEARRREGVTGPLTAQENTHNWNLVELTWTHEDGRSVEISWRKGEAAVWVDVRRKPRRGLPANMAGLVDIDDAATVLRVLAALELIPADIAYAADERYGRCQVCGSLAFWVSEPDPWGPGWYHYPPRNPTKPDHHWPRVSDDLEQGKRGPRQVAE